MKKHFLLFFFLFITTALFKAQIGINTITPQATLDVYSSDSTKKSFRIVNGEINSPASLIVQGNGNVGIGTENPQATIDINGSVGLHGESATPVSGPYEALARNKNTGKVGTYTPGSLPIAVLVTNFDSGNGISSGEEFKVLLTEKEISKFSINTLGSTVGSDSFGDYMLVPESGVYRLDFYLNMRCSTYSSSASLIANVYKTIGESNSYTLLSGQRGGIISSSIGAPVSVSFILVLDSPNTKLNFKVEVGGGGNYGCRAVTGVSYSQMFIITKL